MTMTRRIGTGLAGLCLAAAVQAGPAADAVQARDAYVRAVPPGQPNSAAFLTLNNGAGEGHALVAAESPVAQVVELHTHTMDGGMMRMRRVERIEVPAGGRVALEPGGLHLMLIGLGRQLQPGEQVPLTLIYEDGSRSALEAPVKRVEAMPMQHQHQH